MNPLRITLWLSVFATNVGCSGPAAIPDTPDLSALSASYDAPSASVDIPGAVNVLAQAPPLDRLAAAFRATRIAVDGVDRASQATGPRVMANLRLQGGIHVTLRCPGEQDAPVFDPAINGTVSFTLAVAENSIRRDVGGTASNCILRGVLVPLRVELDGPIAFDLGHDLSIGAGWSGQLLVSVTGDLKIEGISFVGLSARLSDDQFEYLYQLPDGSTVIISLSPDGIRVRGRNGIWFCSDLKTCSAE